MYAKKGLLTFLWTLVATFVAAVNGDCEYPVLGTLKIKDRLNSLSSFSTGTRLQLDCLPGFYYRQSPGRGRSLSTTCLESGKWTDLPNCQKKRCPSFPDLLNGKSELSEDSLYFGGTVKFACDDGFTLVGEPQMFCELQNDKSVNWDNEVPICERKICRPPDSIDFGTFRTVKEQYEYNEVVTYSCLNNSLSLIGEPTRRCSGSDKWVPEKPICKMIKCTDPHVQNGLVMRPGSHKFGESVTITCDDGYELSGPSIVTCSHDSTWMPMLPKCMRRTNSGPHVEETSLHDIITLVKRDTSSENTPTPAETSKQEDTTLTASVTTTSTVNTNNSKSSETPKATTRPANTTPSEMSHQTPTTSPSKPQLSTFAKFKGYTPIILLAICSLCLIVIGIVGGIRHK
ncbi:hypothetical protein [Rhinolophus gammaherpesvirus 1]|uniref:Sushi domain-containing protein n=1 Tax=Rhinolophus gammaherpesvirus 1 TaxID=2054179 RepID=A0A2Z5U719_9GAMA|nr:hypothetical protein [Rhinolophus gammaherpesvirus 1]BBB06451.1 hypothetical protein [Rhinolophus gammaherpesvirus 1]